MQPEPGQVHDLPPLYKEGLGSGVEGTYACPPQGYAVGGNRGSKREPARVGPGGGSSSQALFLCGPTRPWGVGDGMNEQAVGCMLGCAV
jgi:hypothetical protein